MFYRFQQPPMMTLPTDNLPVNFISHFWWLRKKVWKDNEFDHFYRLQTDHHRCRTQRHISIEEQQQNRSGFLLSPIFFSLFDFDELWEVLDSQSNNRLKSLFLVSSHYYQSDLFHSTAFNAAHAKCVKWLEKSTIKLIYLRVWVWSCDDCGGDERSQKKRKKQTIERCDKWLSFAQNHFEHLNGVQLGTFHSFCLTHTIPIQKMLKAMKTYVKKTK